MTIEEIKVRKSEAEKQIAEILQKLHDDTKCRVDDPRCSWEEMTFGSDTIVSCRIELTVK
jgi:hypothetical protein